MSDLESFAARWSRLKRATAKEEQEAASARPAALSAEAAPAAGGRPEPDQAKDVPFDPESLPPIDSITAGSDIKAFLQAGVPKHLTQAALRRAWSADPAIRDFIGLAENQWDFTDPTAIPGFGPLEATDDVRQLVAQAMGRLADSPIQHREEVALASESSQVRDDAPREPAIALQTDDAPPEGEEGVRKEHPARGQQRGADCDEPQTAAPAGKTGDTNIRRTHGGALPK
jgi:hypothetical protein